MQVFTSGALATCLAVLSVGDRICADDKPAAPIDGKKLVGKWEGTALVESSTEKGTTFVEFAADGVVNLKAISGRLSVTNEGKFTLDGDKLTIITKLGKDKEGKVVATITKLTETELVWVNADKKTESWKRIKEEKK